MSSIRETLFSFYFKQNLIPQLYLETAHQIHQKIKIEIKVFTIVIIMITICTNIST